HPLTGSPSSLEHLVEPVKATHRFIKQSQIKHEADQLTNGHSVSQDLPATNPQNQSQSQCTRKAHCRRVGGPDAHNAESSFAQVIGALSETKILVTLPPESFDLTYPLQIIHQQGVHSTGGEALPAVPPMSGQGIPKSTRDQDWQRDQRDCRQ